MKQIFFIADCHLSPTIWKSRRDIHGDAWRALFKAASAIVKLSEGADETAVLWGGDVFDSVTPDAMSEKTLQTLVRRLRDAGIQSFGVQGNHDATRDYPRISVFGVGHLRGGAASEICGRTVCGLDARGSAAELKERLAGVPVCDYLVMHAPFKHLMSLEGKWQVTAQDIPDTVKTVLVGDVHKASVISYKRPDAEPLRIISPGSTHPRRAQEFGRKFGFVKLVVNENGEDGVKYLRIPGRAFHSMDLGSEALNEALAGLVEAKDEERPVFQVRHDAKDVDKLDAVIQRYGDRAHFLGKVNAGDYVFSDESTGSDDEEREVSLHEALEETRENEPDEVVDALALMLTPGNDPRKVLADYAGEKEVIL